MKAIYLLLLALVVSVTSCITKEGEPGPAGGSNLTQQGTVSGTLAYVDNDGNAISVPFAYDYFESATDNKFYFDEGGKPNYQIGLYRRDLKDYNNYIEFSNLNGVKVNNQFNSPTSGSFEFSFVKIINNQLFEFSANFNSSNQNSEYTITNYTFDSATGRVTFDFELAFDPNSINYSTRYDDAEYATVKGKVDVILNRTQTYTPTQLPS